MFAYICFIVFAFSKIVFTSDKSRPPEYKKALFENYGQKLQLKGLAYLLDDNVLEIPGQLTLDRSWVPADQPVEDLAHLPPLAVAILEVPELLVPPFEDAVDDPPPDLEEPQVVAGALPPAGLRVQDRGPQRVVLEAPQVLSERLGVFLEDELQDLEDLLRGQALQVVLAVQDFDEDRPPRGHDDFEGSLDFDADAGAGPRLQDLLLERVLGERDFPQLLLEELDQPRVFALQVHDGRFQELLVPSVRLEHFLVFKDEEVDVQGHVRKGASFPIGVAEVPADFAGGRLARRLEFLGPEQLGGEQDEKADRGLHFIKLLGGFI